MKNKVVCNYAVVRFLPYPETEEFVNVGVILACPESRVIDFKLETRRRDRITDFFPELNPAVFIEGRRDFKREMDRIKNDLNKNYAGQMQFRVEEKAFHQLFREIVKPRESIFRFSRIGTTMVDDVGKGLDVLYRHYVERQFATHEEYQETIMANSLRERLKAEDVLKFYTEQRIGDETYGVKIPFVHLPTETGKQCRAIKPLHLDKQDTTRIIEYGDRWSMRVKRLRDMRNFPDKMLFVVKCPKGEGKAKAAEEVVHELERLDTKVVLETDAETILDFARAV